MISFPIQPNSTGKIKREKTGKVHILYLNLKKFTHQLTKLPTHQFSLLLLCHYSIHKFKQRQNVGGQNNQ